jgi:hypothetical protein
MNRQIESIFDVVMPNAPPSKAISRKEEAYRKILEIVLSGSLGNDAFLNEQPLAEQFGMSRAPVREALQMLCSERILENVPEWATGGAHQHQGNPGRYSRPPLARAGKRAARLPQP